jgi:hypothetical protein
MSKITTQDASEQHTEKEIDNNSQSPDDTNWSEDDDELY